MDGLRERFNKTLKAMLKRFVGVDPWEWDLFLPALLFTVREVQQASTGFSPFELLYSRQPRGILDLLKEGWEEQDTRMKGTVHYILELRKRPKVAGELARDNLLRAQARQARWYNQGARSRVFVPRDRVLLLLLTSDSKLMVKWQGPYEVLRRVGPVDYEIQLMGKRKHTQIYHVNLLKKWNARESMLVTTQPTEPELGPWGGDLSPPKEEMSLGPTLTSVQKEEMRALIRAFAAVLSTQPGRTTVACHHIQTAPGQKVREPLRPLPRKLCGTVQEELQKMLQMGVIQKSRSEWRSPIVLVPMRDGTLWFCIDFWKVNALSKFDAYLMPRTEELLERLWKARYLTTLDLTRGYWQIPLTPASQEKTAFATTFGLYHFLTMPFGLNGDAATFQQLMDHLLEEHRSYAAAYIDDVVIYSTSWEDHLGHIRAILKTLENARLTANPSKCTFGQSEVAYLGYVVGNGRLKPQVDKVKAVRDHQVPTTKKQVRQFLGLAGYYRRVIPHFATIAAPLTDLTKGGLPQKVGWSPQCEKAFQQLKQALTRSPVLAQPDFTKPFLVQTDASGVGLGAVLAQQQDGAEKPILYLSCKLLPREQAYSTIEREALAVQWAVEALRYYLLGSPFQLMTDHAPLQWMHNMRKSNPRIMRWYLFLQQYKYTIVYKAGQTHANADFLSRCVGLGAGEETTEEPGGEGCDGEDVPRTDSRSPRAARGREAAEHPGEAGRPAVGGQSKLADERGTAAADK
uniref:ribonuclease H n=1 Tax=Pelodiscus sinensis TaxID=13735 RepID=K7EZD8_PELSI